MTVESRRGPNDPASLNLRHHGDAETGPGLVDLAVNVRMPGPPDWLRRLLAESLTSLGAYPDPTRAREAIAARHGRRPNEVLLTAGAAEAFTLIARAFSPRRPVVVHPQFTEPEVALRVAGHEVERLLLSREDGFALPVYGIPSAADLVVLGNPTNPTSTLHRGGAVAALARPGRILVVDEAFMDAVPGEAESLAPYDDLPGLIVVRSFTKTWGLAGLRVGYVLAAPDLIAAMAEVQPTWSVSSPALVAAEACSSPMALTEAASQALSMTAERAYLLQRLREFDGVEVAGIPAGPFVLLQVRNGRKVRQRLRDRGYAVRRGDSFPGLGPTWMRIAVRGPQMTDGFLDALQTVQLEGLLAASARDLVLTVRAPVRRRGARGCLPGDRRAPGRAARVPAGPGRGRRAHPNPGRGASRAQRRALAAVGLRGGPLGRRRGRGLRRWRRPRGRRTRRPCPRPGPARSSGSRWRRFSRHRSASSSPATRPAAGGTRWVATRSRGCRRTPPRRPWRTSGWPPGRRAWGSAG